MNEFSNALRLLADETRLRILRLLHQEPLNVSELTAVLGLAQSGVSRHLSMLRKMGVVEERREGIWSYYQLSEKLLEDWGKTENADVVEGRGALASVFQLALAYGESENGQGDASRLQELLRQRDNLARGPSGRLLEPGQSWLAWSRALLHLVPPLERGIDLGCGDGVVALELSYFCAESVGVDINPQAIEQAQQRAKREQRDNIRFVCSKVEKLKLPANSFDVAVFAQSLHHMDAPQQGLSCAAQLLKPGGRLLVIALAPHNQLWVREGLKHQHLGFSPSQLTDMLQKVGLQQVAVGQIRQSRGEVFRVLLASGVA